MYVEITFLHIETADGQRVDKLQNVEIYFPPLVTLICLHRRTTALKTSLKYNNTYPIDPPSPTPVIINQNHQSNVKVLQTKQHEICKYCTPC